MWYFVVFTYDYPNGMAKIYVDGEEEDVDVDFEQALLPSRAFIGRMADVENRYFYGGIDEVKVHRKVLSEAEILEEYCAIKPSEQVCQPAAPSLSVLLRIIDWFKD